MNQFCEEYNDLYAIHALNEREIVIIPLTGWHDEIFDDYDNYIHIVTIGNGSNDHQIKQRIHFSTTDSRSSTFDPRWCSLAYKKQTNDLYIFDDQRKIHRLNLREFRLELLYTYNHDEHNINVGWGIHQLLILNNQCHVIISDVVDSDHIVYHYLLKENATERSLELLQKSKPIGNVKTPIPKWPIRFSSGFDMMENRSTQLVPQSDGILFINQYTLIMMKLTNNGESDMISYKNKYELQGWNGVVLTRDKFLITFEDVQNESKGAFVNILDLKKIIRGQEKDEKTCIRSQTFAVGKPISLYRAILLQDKEREELLVVGYVKANYNIPVPLAIIGLICGWYSKENVFFLNQEEPTLSAFTCSMDHLLDPQKKNLKLTWKAIQ